MTRTVIDLFAGCGGFTQGFVDAGFEPILAIEHDHHAAATYAANFDPKAGHTVCWDIADVPSTMVPRADVVIGGPPCQGFSALGHRNEDDPRNRLWAEYVRIVNLADPRVFVIENVERFLKSPEFDLLVEAVERGPLRGYKIASGVLDASEYGAPQRRRRTIIVGSRVGEPSLPSPTHGDMQLGMRPVKTVRDAFEGIPFEACPSKTMPNETTDIFGELIPGPFAADEIHFGRNPTQLSIERYAEIPPGGGRFDLMRSRPDLLPPCWQKKRTGTTDVMGRMEWDKPSVTIRTEFFKPEKGRYLHPEWSRTNPSFTDRAVTHREAAALQTFPNNFVWCGTRTSIARQIGNAVPPALARSIATSINDHLDGTEATT